MTSHAPLQVRRINGDVVKDSYIVKLKHGTDKHAHLKHIQERVASLSGHSEVTHGEWASDCFHGYAGKFSDASLDALLAHPDVEYIEEDSIVTEDAVITQNNAPWGLSRISQNAKIVGSASSLNFSYSYDSTAGTGVDVYVLDGGIYTQHTEFEGRASWGTTLNGTAGIDGTGHGTHCAGIAGSRQFGAAKAVKLIAVKITGDTGSGSTAINISGLNWVKTTVASTKRPSVISMSVGGPFSQAVNDTVATVTGAGIHVIVSAGNNGVDAKDRSPASAPSAIAVGNSNINDARRSTSNYGSVVALFAPGTDIISCGNSGPNATATKTGTSQACPHVSGLVAYLVGKSGNITPAAMKTKVKDLSLKNILTDIPAGTVNALARNDV